MTTKFKKKIYFFIGTTTELIKLAPIIRELEKRKIKFKVITSGQTKVNFDELSFLINKKNADIHLGEKTDRSSLFIFLIWFLKTLAKIPSLRNEFKHLNKANTYFVVHGDPVSSLVGALVARFYNLKLVHVESGLRSFNYLEPFPEELCRLIISKLADIHFCPNAWSMNNLLLTGGEKINTIENTQIESYFAANKLKSEPRFSGKKYFVLIVHRQEHVIFGKEESKKLIKYILDNANKKLQCIFITHATTLNFLKSVNFKLSSEQKKRVRFVSRLSYVDFVSLISRAEFLVTDGGSNQEEAYYMGLPCLVLRSVTERIEGLGENVVLSRNDKGIIKAFMNNYKTYRRKKIRLKLKPSKIIVDALQNST